MKIVTTDSKGKTGGDTVSVSVYIQARKTCPVQGRKKS